MRGTNEGLTFLSALSERTMPPLHVVSSATEFQSSEPIFLETKSHL